jgi:hypothetical protein
VFVTVPGAPVTNRLTTANTRNTEKVAGRGRQRDYQEVLDNYPVLLASAL